MKRWITTIQVGDKYPRWYSDMLESSLDKYDIGLLVAQEYSVLFRPFLMKWIPKTWWTKILLFNKDFFRKKAIFIDLDTIILQDPTPIIEWCESHPEPIQCVTPWASDKPRFSSPLLYIDHESEYVQQLWDRFCQEKEQPKFERADFFFIHCMEELWGKDYMDKGIVGVMPREFMGRYKICHPFKGENNCWKNMQEKYGKEYPPEKCLTMSFNGHPFPHEVVEQKLPGWEMYEPFMKEWLC